VAILTRTRLARALLAAGCAAGGLWLAGAGALAAAPPRPLEYEVKAAFLFNFAKFVEWPPDSFREREPLTICIFGEDPFGAVLDGTLAGETLAGRPLQARRTDRPGELRSCQIVFIGQAERERVPEVLASLRGANVLTVGESDRFLATGGMIEFFNDHSHVRLRINLEAARASALQISSKLLRVAQVVAPSSLSR
jgi:hypothetical protein